VGVVARRGDEFLLIRQYRFIVDQWVWAIPSGGISEGESAEEAAMRELVEETGYAATRVEPIVHYYPSYGSGDQQFQLFLASEVTKTGNDFDRSEVHDVRWFSRVEVQAMLEAGPDDKPFGPAKGAIAYRLMRDWIDWKR
jgi:8-oxo-dGTP pyrophosphatase MutT (NUDIX family)